MYPYEQQIYKISDANDLEHSYLICLTCQNTSINLAQTCSYYRGSMSRSYRYIIIECLGPTVPYTSVYSIEDMKVVKDLNKESDIRRELVNGLEWREKRYTFDLADGSLGYIQLFLPLKWSEYLHGRLQFPMIIEV